MSTAPDLKFAFGNFNYICSTVSLTLCPLVGGPDGIEPVCYSRNVRIADTLIFQPCKSFFLLSLSLLPCHVFGHVAYLPLREKVIISSHSNPVIPWWSKHSSHVDYSYHCTHHDRHHDIPHPIEIHRCR